MRRLNMVAQMDQAFREKKTLSLETYQNNMKAKLSWSFVAVERELREANAKLGYSYDEDTFYMYQRIIVFIMLCDNDLLTGEYDAYKLVCQWAKIEPLSPADCRALYNRTSADKVLEDINLIKACRGLMSDDDYEKLTLSLCYLAHLGDNAVDEGEYLIIKQLYDPSFDYVPSTWERFKTEYMNY